MIRLIGRLDLRNSNHIKTVNCEGVRIIRPLIDSIRHFSEGDSELDELIVIDTVASLYGYQNWLLRSDYEHFFAPIPLCVAGAIDSVACACKTLSKGADKIALNSSAIAKPSLLGEISGACGQQALVLQIDTRKIDGIYYCFFNGGRELSRYRLDEWISIAHDNGVGELHVTAIDSEGTRHPFPRCLADKLTNNTHLPVIISGGLRSPEQIASLYFEFGISSFSFSSLVNICGISVNSLRSELASLNLPVRNPPA
jgi:cyclase